MNLDEQLQARILTFVIREFLDNGRATPRLDLILAFENEAISDALSNLALRMLRRKDNAVPEHFLPTAAAFHYCDDDTVRGHAKKAVTAVLHTMRRMFKANRGEKSYTFEDLAQQVRELYPRPAFDDPTIKLGLYLSQDFNVLSLREMNLPEDTEIVRFQINEAIITTYRPLDAAWDIMAGWYRPAPVEPPGADDFLAATGAPPSTSLETNQFYLPAGSQHDAYVELRKIIQLAKHDMLIVDVYVDETLWELLTNVLPTIKIRILTNHMKKDFRLEAGKFCAQHRKPIEIRTTSKCHDRFIIEDGQRCWHIGASIKDAGDKAFAFSEFLGPELVKFVIADVESQWLAAAPVTL